MLNGHEAPAIGGARPASAGLALQSQQMARRLLAGDITSLRLNARQLHHLRPLNGFGGIRSEGRQWREHDLHLTGHEVDQGRSLATIRYVEHIGAGARSTLPGFGL